MSDSNISLARSGRAHYVIRALDREVPSASPTMDDLSSLLAARSLKALVESVDVLPPLLPHTDDHTAIRILQGLDRADAELLSRELPSYTHLAMRRVTARAVERLSGDRVETRPGSTVVAEAVSDWVLARNLLGVTAKLVRLSSERDDPMSVAGFELDERLDTWVLTVGFDPFAGAEWERAGVSLFQTLAGARDSSCDILSRGTLGTPHAGLCYLRCPQVGSQVQCARRVVNSIVDSTASMRSPMGGSYLGWREDTSMRFADQPAPSFVADSGFAEMMRMVVYRGSSRIAICSECGGVVIQGAKGPLKEWCSPACRMAWVRRDARRRTDQDLHAMAGARTAGRGRSDA